MSWSSSLPQPAMEVVQPVAPLSPSAEETPTNGVYTNSESVDAPAGDAVGGASEEPAPESSAATEEQPSASFKPKAAISPAAKPLKKTGGPPPTVLSTTKPGRAPS